MQGFFDGEYPGQWKSERKKSLAAKSLTAKSVCWTTFAVGAEELLLPYLATK